MPSPDSLEHDISGLTVSDPAPGSPSNSASQPTSSDSVTNAIQHAPEPERTSQRASAEILEQFDPLADSSAKQEERHSPGNGNPMGPSVASPQTVGTPSSPQVDALESTNAEKADGEQSSSAAGSSTSPAAANAPTPASIGSGLSSLANFARSFTIPKVRTRSVDIAPPPNIITPNTISSFAAQQQSRPGTPANVSTRQQPSTAGEGSAQTSGSGPVLTSESGSSTANRTRQKDEAPPFDFQLFLDQMKSRSAEPVAKFLRSYVLALSHISPTPLTRLCQSRFLSNFAKRSLAINEQIKVINEFLNVCLLLHTPKQRLMRPKRSLLL